MTRTLATDDSARVFDVRLELAHEVGGRGELDVGVQPPDEPELEPALIQVTLEIEQEGLNLKLRAAEGRPVTDRQRCDEIAFRRMHPAGVSAQRGNELVGLWADVRSR